MNTSMFRATVGPDSLKVKIATKELIKNSKNNELQIN